MSAWPADADLPCLQQFTAQPGLGEADFVSHDVNAAPHRLGDLLGRQTAKIPHHNDIAELRVFAAESFDRLVEVRQIHAMRRAGHLHFDSGIPVHPQFIAAAPGSSAGARVVHQNLPHDTGGERHEVGAPGELRRRVAEDL